ncbi:hypothetical protein [Thalassobius sp. Cn5-15]|uniref:hypothetical protein n=1 Tax=Thalassobius sp. Cn5-15 TaxID=2917763 RepID=UPI001EF2E3FB|nr:hypothetical protein [Thalassobius sp. Cn5-15]MCG7495030.1 hypothetical protein [Thalassobius sp. Cn5-15]
MKALFSVVCILALTLTGVLYSKNWIYPRCQATGTVLSEEELLQNFLDDVLKGNSPAPEYLSLLEQSGDGKLEPFASGEEYLRLAENCCQLGRKEYDLYAATIHIQKHDPAWYMRSSVRGLITWEPAMKSMGENDRPLVVYGKRAGRVVYSEDWIDHCGRWLPVPISFVVG